MPPEVTGAVQAFRVVRPLFLAIGGTLPVLAARAAENAGGSAVAGAAAGSRRGDGRIRPGGRVAVAA